REVEREPANAFHAASRVHADTDRGLAISDPMLHVAVEALGVLANDDEIQARIQTWHAGEGEGGTNVSVEIEFLTQCDVDAPKAQAHRGRAGALERDPCLRDRGQGG